MHTVRLPFPNCPECAFLFAIFCIPPRSDVSHITFVCIRFVYVSRWDRYSSISNIDDGTYRCPDGSSPTIRHKRISGVLGAASSVTSIQVANLLRLFKIPQ
ncbi:uncharacterized protein CDAR_8351, partial [Caerostris darwini]